MNYRAGVITGAVATLCAVGIAASAWWLATARPPETKPTQHVVPASVSRIFKEEESTQVVLSLEAEQRLGIRTEPAERKAMKRMRSYGGEVTVPAGCSILVAAPLGGMLRTPPSGAVRPGATVKKGQPILLFQPLLTPDAKVTLASAKVDAEGLVKNARAQRDAAQIALTRAQRLLREGAGSKRNVDEAQAQYELGSKSLEAAEARCDLLTKVIGEGDSAAAAAVTIDAPQDGLLRTMSALPGQTVPSGAALFEVVDLKNVWVRVPVYVGDLSEIAQDADATVGDLSGRQGRPTRAARPALAPPSANPLAATADLYYELDNRGLGLAPGQRVGVTLPLAGEAESLTVPWSAVIHDIHGGAWVYARTAPQTFVRRRVRVRYVVGSVAVMAEGPAPGSPIVAAGAAELFGTEIGFSK